MLIKWTMFGLLVAVEVRAHEHESNFNAWNVPPTKTSNVKEMKPRTSDIIYMNPVPMDSNGLREQNDAIAAVYGPAFLRVDWIQNDFNTQNKKYNSELDENGGHLDKSYNRDEMRDIYSHEIEMRHENYNYQDERNGKPDVRYNQERGGIQSDLYIYERKQRPENRNWRSQETQETELDYANIQENNDADRKDQIKKPIFPKLHQLRIDAKRVLEGPVSKIRALLPQLKHLEDKDIIHILRGVDDRLLGGLGQRTKELIIKIREQFNKSDSEKVIDRKPKPESIETVGNRLYAGYDDPSYPQRIRSEEGQYEGGRYEDYGKENKETPHGWGKGYQPGWARLPEVSFQGRYHGMDSMKDDY